MAYHRFGDRGEVIVSTQMALHPQQLAAFLVDAVQHHHHRHQQRQEYNGNGPLPYQQHSYETSAYVSPLYNSLEQDVELGITWESVGDTLHNDQDWDFDRDKDRDSGGAAGTNASTHRSSRAAAVREVLNVLHLSTELLQEELNLLELLELDSQARASEEDVSRVLGVGSNEHSRLLADHPHRKAYNTVSPGINQNTQGLRMSIPGLTMPAITPQRIIALRSSTGSTSRDPGNSVLVPSSPVGMQEDLMKIHPCHTSRKISDIGNKNCGSGGEISVINGSSGTGSGSSSGNLSNNSSNSMFDTPMSHTLVTVHYAG
jgi:hypothetical protein